MAEAKLGRGGENGDLHDDTVSEDLACFVAEDGVADGADLHFVVVVGADRGEKASGIGAFYVENR